MSETLPSPFILMLVSDYNNRNKGDVTNEKDVFTIFIFSLLIDCFSM